MTRCFENERVQTAAELTADGDAVAAVELSAVAGMMGGGGDSTAAPRRARASPPRRRRAGAAIRQCAGCARSPRRTAGRDRHRDVADIYVFPVVPPQPTGIPRTELPDRLART